MGADVLPWYDPTLPIDTRLDKLIQAMSLEEQVAVYVYHTQTQTNQEEQVRFKCAQQKKKGTHARTHTCRLHRRHNLTMTMQDASLSHPHTLGRRRS